MKRSLPSILEPHLARWRALQTRERVAVVIEVVVLGGFLSYDFLWAPMAHELHELRVAVPRDRARLATMRSQALEIQRLRATGGVAHLGSGAAILATLEQSAADYGLKQSLAQLEPDGSSGARLVIRGVAFNTLVTWLRALQLHNGVRVRNAAIEAKSSPGIVDARLELRGPGT